MGAREIISLGKFVLERRDKVALVGRNGAGKTTLLRMITGDIVPDEGRIRVKGSIGMIPQFYEPGTQEIDYRIAGQLFFDQSQVFSGGEQVKESIAKAFSFSHDILLADEPTTNLDIPGIRCLETLVEGYAGGLIIVSHDRMLLEKVCNKVLEIERGVCTIYHCGYAEYVRQKALETQSQKTRYYQYAAEKNRLKRVAAAKANQSKRIRKTPKRMGNSEARLHKTDSQKAKEAIDRSAKAAISRLYQLEAVKKPWEEKEIVFDVKSKVVHNPVVVSVKGVSKAYNGKSILQDCSFTVPGGKKTALVGANGAGKTTLVNMIVSGVEGVSTCKRCKIGYFRQDVSDLDDEKSILENVMSSSAYDEKFSRTILSRLLFHRDELDIKAGSISGGERIKLALAKIILSDFTLLILDEPTNYLDAVSRDALESVLAAYSGALLFVSHDRMFISNVADRIIYIKDQTTYTVESEVDAFLFEKEVF